MLEVFVVRETVFFLTGVMIGIGAIARLITGISLKKLVRAASKMCIRDRDWDEYYRSSAL